MSEFNGLMHKYYVTKQLKFSHSPRKFPEVLKIVFFVDFGILLRKKKITLKKVIPSNEIFHWSELCVISLVVTNDEVQFIL